MTNEDYLLSELKKLQQVIQEKDLFISALAEENKWLLGVYKENVEKDRHLFFISYICSYYKVSREDLESNSRKAPLPYIRQIISYVLDFHFGMTHQSISEILKCDRSTIATNSAKIEHLMHIDREIMCDMTIHRNWLRRLNKV
jgi:chromosomal replication initiation ATPase DnaA